MEERLAYSSTEQVYYSSMSETYLIRKITLIFTSCVIFNPQDMVLLHHEVEVDFPDSQHTEHHIATLLEFGRAKNGKMISAMALTVGVPVAIGALVLV